MRRLNLYMRRGGEVRRLNLYMRRGGEEIVPVHEEGRRGEETVPVHEEGRGGEKTVHHDRAVGEEADELLLPELPLQTVRLLTKGTVKNMPVIRLLSQISIKIMLISNSSLFYLGSMTSHVH